MVKTMRQKALENWQTYETVSSMNLSVGFPDETAGYPTGHDCQSKRSIGYTRDLTRRMIHYMKLAAIAR